MKALPVYIYKHRGEDFSNGGISSKYNEILILCEDGFVDVDTDNPPENLCEIVKRELWGEEHWYVKPVAEVKSGNVGYMSGGCVVNSCDSRWSRLSKSRALPLHDRQETQEQYNVLSH